MTTSSRLQTFRKVPLARTVGRPNGLTAGRASAELRRMIANADPSARTGITRYVSEIERHLSLWEMLEPSGFST
jgi:hypothetical protein